MSEVKSAILRSYSAIASLVRATPLKWPEMSGDSGDHSHNDQNQRDAPERPPDPIARRPGVAIAIEPSHVRLRPSGSSVWRAGRRALSAHPRESENPDLHISK